MSKITPDQKRVIINNNIGLTHDEIDNITKEQAIWIIGDMFSYGAAINGRSEIRIPFWQDVKKRLQSDSEGIEGIQDSPGSQCG